VRAIQLQRQLPADWHNISAVAWAGLTAAFCRQHGAGVIIRGVRNRSDFLHEYQLAAMNEYLGVTTLLLPARPALAGVSSTVLRGRKEAGTRCPRPGPVLRGPR
jgi:pantetheine-phosphate adenylyltransferase